MFIGWINQMVALLDKPEGMAVHDILLSIAKEYPQVGVVFVRVWLISCSAGTLLSF